MSVVKVILKKDILNFGEEGDVKRVKRGYARNFLLPTGAAVEFSIQNQKILDAQKERIEKKKLQKKEHANELAKKLESVSVKLNIPSGDKGRLYGTVTNNAICEQLVVDGYEIDRRQIELKDHIKYGGSYKFRIHIYQEIYANMTLDVIPVQEEKKQAPVRKKRNYRRDEADQDNNAEDQLSESSSDNSEQS